MHTVRIKVESGLLSRMVISLPLAEMLSILERSRLLAFAFAVSKLNTTSSAVMAVPSENFAPSRRVNA